MPKDQLPPGIAKFPPPLVVASAQRLKGAQLDEVAPNVVLPDRFQATVVPANQSLPRADLVVHIADGEPRCMRLILIGRNGAAVTGETLRAIRLGEYVREALAEATIRYTREQPEVEHADEPFTVDGEDAWRDRSTYPLQADYDAGRDVARRARRGRLTDDDLQRVAETYRAAVRRKLAPTEQVAHNENVSRTTASRWIARARERGFLGAALPGRAGEHPDREGTS